INIPHKPCLVAGSSLASSLRNSQPGERHGSTRESGQSDKSAFAVDPDADRQVAGHAVEWCSARGDTNTWVGFGGAAPDVWEYLNSLRSTVAIFRAGSRRHGTAGRGGTDWLSTSCGAH